MPKQTRKKPAKPAERQVTALVPLERIEQAIYLIRGQRVMLDSDLAAFYGVSTIRLNEQVKRNRDRFPADFTFQLTAEEYAALRSQFAISNSSGSEPGKTGTATPHGGRGGRRYLPFVFTEHGAIMAASVLHSERAVQVSLLVVRAFVRLRQILSEHRDLARRIEALEREFVHRTDEHEAHIRRIYEILDDLMNPPAPPKKGRIGFVG